MSSPPFSATVLIVAFRLARACVTSNDGALSAVASWIVASPPSSVIDNAVFGVALDTEQLAVIALQEVVSLHGVASNCGLPINRRDQLDT